MLSEKKFDYVLYFLLCIPAVFFLFNPAKFPADDGFFYPQIAYNFVHGKGSYFNDLYLTNGYHPLWMLFCVIAELINPFGKQDVVYILWIFQVLFFILGIYLIRYFFENKKYIRFIVFMVLNIAFLGIGTLFLTEAHLNFFTLCMLLNFLLRKNKNDWIFGLICGFAFLARLDNVFIIMLLGIYYWNFKNRNPISLIKILIGFSVLAIPYLLSNMIYFDNIVPISGRIKSTFPHFRPDIVFQFWQKIFFACIVFYYILLIFGKKINYKSLKIKFVTASFLLLVYNILFQYDVMQWYFVSQLLVTALLLYDGLNIFKINLPIYAKKAICGLLILISITIPAIKLSGNFSFQKYFKDSQEMSFYNDDPIKSATEKISRITLKNARIFVYDFPGKYAFYSDRNFIPADGLVGNAVYFQEISEISFTNYLRKNNIEYLVLPAGFVPEKESSFSFIGLKVEGRQNNLRYFIKNPKDKKIVSQINLSDFKEIAVFENPAKFWHPFYRNIKVYQLKK